MDEQAKNLQRHEGSCGATDYHAGQKSIVPVKHWIAAGEHKGE